MKNTKNINKNKLRSKTSQFFNLCTKFKNY